MNGEQIVTALAHLDGMQQTTSVSGDAPDIVATLRVDVEGPRIHFSGLDGSTGPEIDDLTTAIRKALKQHVTAVTVTPVMLTEDCAELCIETSADGWCEIAASELPTWYPLRFEVRGRDAGQIVERSYASGDGCLYRRTEDRGSREVTYEVKDVECTD